MSADWLITPRKGIGHLHFDLAPEAVTSMSDLYGSPSPLISWADTASEVEKVIAELGDAMPPEAVAA